MSETWRGSCLALKDLRTVSHDNFHPVTKDQAPRCGRSLPTDIFRHALNRASSTERIAHSPRQNRSSYPPLQGVRVTESGATANWSRRSADGWPRPRLVRHLTGDEARVLARRLAPMEPDQLTTDVSHESEMTPRKRFSSMTIFTVPCGSEVLPCIPPAPLDIF